MQVFLTVGASPLLWAPGLTGWLIHADALLALAYCTLHEGDTQLVAPGLSRPCPATERLPKHPLWQFHPTPAEDPGTSTYLEL